MHALSSRLGLTLLGVALAGCGSGRVQTGSDAAAGATGAAGDTGAAGATGAGGTTGVAGDTGAAGASAAGNGGAAGEGGAAAGVTGSAGTGGGGASGAAGAAGTAGKAGSGGGGVGGTTSGAGGRDLSTDRALFLGASRCAQAKVQLCEDFESGTLDAATWTTRGGKPVIDGLQHARGGKALHVTVVGAGLSGISEKKTFPAVDNTYYGRAFVYFKSLPVINGTYTYSHWTMLAASGTQVSGEIRVGGQLQGANHWGIGTDNRTDVNGTGDWTNSDRDPNGKPLAVPTDTWMCIEWMHKGSTNETGFWWDGVEHPSLHTVPTTPHGGNKTEPYLLPQFTSVWLGWQEYQPTTETFELWLDEIAIDKDRIGCVL
jgi:hypothetical protein